MKKNELTPIKYHFHSKMKYSTVFFIIVTTVFIFGIAPVAAQNSGFGSEKTSWRGFDRYDFIMDDATGAITPITAPESELKSFGIDVSLKD
jgi:hypothetical protein